LDYFSDFKFKQSFSSANDAHQLLISPQNSVTKDCAIWYCMGADRSWRAKNWAVADLIGEAMRNFEAIENYLISRRS
jgi:hypothetical protein